jgi:hypothetical protein
MGLPSVSLKGQIDTRSNLHGFENRGTYQDYSRPPVGSLPELVTAYRSRENLKRIMALALLAVLSLPAHASAAPNSCPKWEPLLRRHFPAKVVPVMSRIAYRESRCTERALSPVRKSTGRPDVGLLQIQGSWATVTRAVCKKQDVIKALLNAQCNVKVAAHLYNNGGLGHWRATSGK